MIASFRKLTQILVKMQRVADHSEGDGLLFVIDNKIEPLRTPVCNKRTTFARYRPERLGRIFCVLTLRFDKYPKGNAFIQTLRQAIIEKLA